MIRWRTLGLAWLVLATYLLPAPALAQATKAGVVTTLEGNVTAARAVAPQPVVLKFKDDVFQQDRVVTGEQSFARLLLGGKAVVSIRERSAVTITEVPGRSTIDIESGKIALSVARDRMQPGEVINIKTPNAVAGVRGTVVVAQVTYRQGPGGVRQPLSDLWVLRGLVDAIHISLAGVPLSPAVPLGARESFRADQIGTIVEGLRAQQPQDPGTASQGPARREAVNAAMALLTSVTGQQLATGLSSEITIPTGTTPKQTVTEVMDITSSPIVLSTAPLSPPTFNMITLQSGQPNGQPDGGPGCEARSPNGSRDQGRWVHGRSALDDGFRGRNPRA